MLKVFTGVIIVWCTLTWAVTYEEFAADAETFNSKAGRLATWIAFMLYPLVLPAFLVYRIVVGSARALLSAVKSIFRVGRGKYSGEVFLTQKKRHDGKRRHGRREFNHYGRD